MVQQIYRLAVVQNVLAVRRARRAAFLLTHVEHALDAKILDIGCGRDGRSLEQHLPNSFRVVGIDLNPVTEVVIEHPNFTYFQQDARDLSRFGSKEFEVAFSIGMMEHIGERSDLDQMSAEIRRVARQWVIVVPWLYAWVEPHFKLPFFQLYPYSVQCALTMALDLNHEGASVRRDPEHLHRNYLWRRTAEWKTIFHADRAVVLPSLETIAIIGSAPD